MTTMTRVQAEALAAFVSRMRPEWRTVGIVAALEKAASTADAWDVAHALLNLAAEPSVLTPGLLPGPGPHWRRSDGTQPTRRGDNDVYCPEHPTNVHPCPACESKRTPPPHDDPEYAELTARFRSQGGVKGRRGPVARRDTRAITAPDDVLERARARAAEEARK